MTTPFRRLLVIAAVLLGWVSNVLSDEPNNINAWMIYTTIQSCQLAAAESVRQDVDGLSAEHAKKLGALHEHWEAKMKDFRKANRKPTEEQITRLYDELTADILSVIKPPQLARLQQIQFQCDGPAKVVVMHPASSIIFGLSEETQKKIFSIEMKYQHQLAEASFKNISPTSPKRQTDPPEIVKLRQDRNNEALDLMTQPQRDAWEKLIGQPLAAPLRDTNGKRVHPKVISLP
ncbi:hypothetical protein Pan97_24910 [Bremerella volcania]|uniref:LTXXQ motif protein n=1 Tax=Bremerella volcania TaxID=2527984 RepID=A0A518C8A8_9BACT|nr:hypothetical protein [Bremerella volcania]QDU75459.1 hypothetical protein Pan97_24910 [Bremerella volcania]